MPGNMRVVIWNVEHGACAMVQHVVGQGGGRLAMIDCGRRDAWRPSTYIKSVLGRDVLDYLFVTNADQDHLSDLQGLSDAGIRVPVWFRNPSPNAFAWREMKQRSGPLTVQAERFIAQCNSSCGFPAEPFDGHMGGITCRTFHNPYPTFTDTNNLSLVVFIRYANFKMLFPGDLEGPGWQALLKNPAFCAELAGTDILVASHHGRKNGYCEDIFNYFTPSAVVISDKRIEHETQETVPDYRAVVRDRGVRVRTTMKDRHVLTTRRDGWIQFTVSDDTYLIDTEFFG
jgi:beta-lactamase superfamily II metal-dependent hydrolase